ncbi:hypothetical protein H4R34_004984 [Dimargaris verticillata]|uniref:Uncharacterized protein n=1 Tax=Dimargaris verticillata TaxID=2761393 RepID=A0A9W8B4G9_9FUNG|nr:hypothetical protein H4R34_004984 [Dimargaris verticillata]
MAHRWATVALWFFATVTVASAAKDTLIWPATYDTLHRALASGPAPRPTAQSSQPVATKFKEVLYKNYGRHSVYGPILGKLAFQKCDNKLGCLIFQSINSSKLVGLTNDVAFILLRHDSLKDLFPFISIYVTGELRALMNTAGESSYVDYQAIRSKDMQQTYPVLHLRKTGQSDVAQLILVALDVQIESWGKNGKLDAFVASQLDGVSVLKLKGRLARAHPERRDVMRLAVQALRRDALQAAVLDMATQLRQDNMVDWSNMPNQGLKDAGTNVAALLKPRTKVTELWLDEAINPFATQLRSLLGAFPAQQQMGAQEMIASWAFGLGLPVAPYLLASLIWHIMDREGLDAMAFPLYHRYQFNANYASLTSSLRDLGRRPGKQATTPDQRKTDTASALNQYITSVFNRARVHWAAHQFQAESTTRSKCLDRSGLP